MDRDLVALEDAPDDRNRLSSVFRTIHTIKGTCGFLGFPILEHVTHVGESLLVKLRDGEFEWRVNDVKELAKETAKATENIAQKIDAIQRDTHGAVEAIGEITSTTVEIGRNVIEATLGSSEIARNISVVAKAAENTTEGAANTQRAGE